MFIRVYVNDVNLLCVGAVLQNFEHVKPVRLELVENCKAGDLQIIELYGNRSIYEARGRDPCARESAGGATNRLPVPNDSD